MTRQLYIDKAGCWGCFFFLRKPWNWGHSDVHVDDMGSFSVFCKAGSEKIHWLCNSNPKKSHIRASAGTYPEIADVEEKNIG